MERELEKNVPLPQNPGYNHASFLCHSMRYYFGCNALNDLLQSNLLVFSASDCVQYTTSLLNMVNIYTLMYDKS
jgi:hypothetical protein